MPMTSLDALLARVLAEDGWDVQRGPVDDSILLESRDERVLVTWNRAPRDPDGDPEGTDAEFLPAASRRSGASQDAGEFLPNQASTTPDTATEPTTDEASDDTGSTFIDATVAPDEAQEEASPSSNIQEVETEPAQGGTSSTSSDASEPPAAPADEEGVVPVVRLRVDEDEVRKETEPKLLEIESTTLELVPHLAFEYRCTLPNGRGGTTTHTGTLLYNALNEDIVILEVPRFSDGAPEGARLLEGQVGPDHARKGARKHLKRAYTENIEVETDDGNVSMMETRRVTPEPDDIHLDAQGTWYLPVWRVKGSNGTLRVDAHSGDILEESLQKATGTDAEWV